MNIENTLIGIELEFAIVDAEGQMVIMCDELPEHGKDNPLNIGRCDYSRKPVLLHHDNVLLEATIGPVRLAHELQPAINSLIFRVKEWVENHWNREYQVLATPSVKYSNLESEASHQIGCNPSASVYDSPVAVDSAAFESGLRTCGLHLNIDAPDDAAYRELLIKNLDRLLYKNLKTRLAAIPDIAGESERRAVYGQAGEHRSYHLADGDLFEGIEYRVLSPQSLLHVNITNFIRDALTYTNRQQLVHQRITDEEIQRGINTMEFS